MPNEKKIIENNKDPIAPDTVLFGLNFVNFLPLNIFPKANPPISDATQVIKIRKIKIFKFKKKDKTKKNILKQKIKHRKTKLVIIFFIFSFLKIIDDILLNSNKERTLIINKK